MLLALSIAVFAVALGMALGLFSGRTALWLQPVYAFGVVAALVVVAGHLVPEAASRLGMPALLVFAIGLIVPGMVERLAARPDRSGHPQMQVGFLALLAHQAGDGAALAAAARTGAALEVGLAIAAHTVPLVTLMTALMARELGNRRAILRAATMALALVGGALALAVVPEAAFEVVGPYASALIAGVLVHVVLHAPPQPQQRPAPGRILEMTAIAAGVAMALAGAHDQPPLLAAVWTSASRLALAVAPALLAGLVMAAAVQALGARMPATWMKSGARLLQALRGAVIGVPLPVCTCGVLPTARALLERGAAPALLVAFVVAAPVLGLDTFLVTARLLDWPFALLRMLGAMLIAVLAALAASRRKKRGGDMTIRALARAPQRLAGKAPLTALPTEKGASVVVRAVHHFDELVFHVVPWAAAGIMVASYVDVLLPDATFSAPVLDVLVMTAVAVPMYMSASAVTPIAAVLLAKGLSPGAALVGLLVGPATDVATIAFLRKSFGGRATSFAVAALVAGSLVLAFAANAADLSVHPLAAAEDGIAPRLCLVILIVLAVRSIWQSGVVAWAEALSRTPSLEWRVSRAYARL